MDLKKYAIFVLLVLAVLVLALPATACFGGCGSWLGRSWLGRSWLGWPWWWWPWLGRLGLGGLGGCGWWLRRLWPWLGRLVVSTTTIASSNP